MDTVLLLTVKGVLITTKVEFISNVPSIGCPSVPVKNMWAINVNGKEIGAIWFNPCESLPAYDVIIFKRVIAQFHSLDNAQAYVEKLMSDCTVKSGERSYKVIIENLSSGSKTVMNAYPLTHDEACTNLSKLTVRKSSRNYIEEIL